MFDAEPYLRASERFEVITCLCSECLAVDSTYKFLTIAAKAFDRDENKSFKDRLSQ
jgi:hypothetical protein